MATIPSIRDWLYGEFLTDAKMDEISAMLSFTSGKLGGFFIGYQAVAQSVSNNTPSAINMDSEVIDIDGGHSTSVNTSRYTLQTDGYYFAAGVYAAAANNTGERRADLYKNGSVLTVPYRSNINAITQSGEPSCVHTFGFITGVVGDYIQLMGTQQSGGALNTEITATKSSLLVCHLKVN